MILVSFLSVFVAAALLWLAFVISYLSNGAVSFGGNTIITLMGLFLPFVVMGMAFAFVYLAMELKRLQLKLTDWVNVFKCEVLNDTVAVHEQIGQMVQAQMDDTPAVMSISKSEPMAKYKDLELPEDVELRFKK